MTSAPAGPTGVATFTCVRDIRFGRAYSVPFAVCFVTTHTWVDAGSASSASALRGRSG